MYDDLVMRLREPCQYENCILCQQAADAIEELTGLVQEAERDRDEYRERLDKANDDIEELQKHVPKVPHGRLIDADKMRESIRKQTAFLRILGGEFAEIAETLEKGFLQEIDNAPTIIPADPAEEGET